MGDRAFINQSYGGRQSLLDGEAIQSAMGGAQGSGGTPAPTFTVQPLVSPSSGTAGITTFTATPGTVSNGSITSRAWLLNGSSISTGTTAAPATEGTLTYQEFATGAGGSASSAVQSVTVAAAGAQLSYKLLSDFETAVGTASNNTLSQHTGSRKVLNTAGLRMQGGGSNPAQGVNGFVAASTLDFASYDRIMYAIDLGTEPLNPVSQVKPRIVAGANTYTPQFDTAIAGPADGIQTMRGKIWASYSLADLKIANFAGASIQSIGTTAKRVDLQVTDSGSAASDIVVDAAVLTTGHKPTLLITFDDVNYVQRTTFFPLMQARGQLGNVYVCRSELRGDGNKMSVADVTDLRAAGWAIALDSERTDNPAPAFTTRAAFISALNADRAYGISTWGDTEGAKHLCYSYGSVGYVPTPKAIACTANGTTTLNVGATNAYTFLAPGLRIFNAAKALVGTVVSLDGQGVITTSTALSSSETYTFSACVQGLTVSAVSGAVLTLSSTDFLFPGMHLLALGATEASAIRIASVDSTTQVTLDKTAPAGITRATFAYLDGEWWPTKVADDLLANGYLTGRTTVQNSHCTAYGIDPKAVITMPGVALPNGGPYPPVLAQIRANAKNGRDTNLYIHTTADTAALTTFLDGVKADTDAGLYEVLTLPAWYAKASARDITKATAL